MWEAKESRHPYKLQIILFIHLNIYKYKKKNVTIYMRNAFYTHLSRPLCQKSPKIIDFFCITNCDWFLDN